MAAFDDSEMFSHPLYVESLLEWHKRCREPISNESREEVFANFQYPWFWKEYQNKHLVQQILDERYNFGPQRPYVASRAFYQNVVRIKVYCLYCSSDLLTFQTLESHNSGRKHKRYYETEQIATLGKPGAPRPDMPTEIDHEQQTIDFCQSETNPEPPVVDLESPAVEPLAEQHNHDATFHDSAPVVRKKTPATRRVQMPA
ncbi:uncharacterized protein LOC122251648 isoform X1 [Penaeus japonicus]|uniref:uncharacterized protein LOC122251648 isoform X1 n=1 Tax=Penaeus japonicus TaxID=27405 RepID=UPI001C716CCB|nr:uncharacterized protein LOC122251648 isoform X1 [Penaeus japonicus]